MIILAEQVTPTTPSAGKSVIYPKSDGFWYYKDDAGVETRFVAGGAVTGSGITMAADRLLGRDTAGTGAIEEITIGDKLTLSGGELNAIASSFNKNAIINGEFNVWQRGTSFATVATAAYTADRWQYTKVGAMVHTISRSTDVPTVAQAGRLFNYSLLVDCTTVDAAIAAGDICHIAQKIEGYNWLPLAQRIITASFWVKGTKTGIHSVFLRNSGSDRSVASEFTINVTNTWEYKTVTFAASPSAGTWDYTTGTGVVFGFVLASGTDFHVTTPGTWESTDDIASANQVNACDNVANNFQITGVQLEVGDEDTAFEARTIQAELEMCQRYYEKSYEIGDAPGTSGVSGYSGFVVPNNTIANGQKYGSVYFKVRKRLAPTAPNIAFWGFLGESGQASNESGVAIGATTAGNDGNAGETGLRISNGSGGTPTTAGLCVLVHWAVSSEL